MTTRRVRIDLPDAPDPTTPEGQAALEELDPLPVTIAAGTPLVRSHPSAFRSAQFYEGRLAGARFSAFSPAHSPAAFEKVLYAADTADGALSETVLHDVPPRGPGKQIPRAATLPMVLSNIAPLRTVRLVDLTSVGMSRLELSRAALIESDRRFYPATAAWARALHAHRGNFDGLLWVSRQHDTSRAVVFFEDRISEGDFELLSDPGDPAGSPRMLPLAFGPGRDLVDDICDRAGITIVEP